MVLRTVFRLSQTLLLCIGIFGIVVGGLHILLDVTMRLIAGKPVPGAMESSSMLLAMAAAAFFTVTELNGMHVRTTLLLGRLPDGLARRLDGLYRVVGAALMVLVGYCLWLDAVASMEFGDLSDVMLLPVYPFKFACTAGVLIFAATLLGRGLRELSGAAPAPDGGLRPRPFQE